MQNINDAGWHTAPFPDGAPHRDIPRHTLTITQAKQVFISFGVPRSTRSIQRFCENGSIDCIRVKGDKIERYFISQPSAQRYALELKQLERISHIEDDVSRNDTSRRDATRHDATSHGEAVPAVAPAPTATQDDPAVFSARVDVLEKENFQLKIDRSAKEQVIGHMMEERQVFLAQLTEQSREIGRLETHMQQLSAPSDTSRYDATNTNTTVVAPKSEEEIEPVDIEPRAPSDSQSVSEHPTRSVWAKLFG